MKLRTKFILFFGTFLFAIAFAIYFYAENYVGGIYRQQAISDVRTIAEQSESAYLAFLGSIKVRANDWTSDSTLRDMAKALLAVPKNSSERARLANKFGTYVREKKMPYDKTVVRTELLDRDGIVIASTDPKIMGLNEKHEEINGSPTHKFKATWDSKFGEAYFGDIELGDEKSPLPVMSVTVRLFEPIDSSVGAEPKPIDAILLIYFENISAISETIGSGTSIYAGLPAQTGRLTSKALVESYKTSDVYLVNNDYTLVTPSRSVKDISVKQKVDTLPVRECLKNGKEISTEYDNFIGARVFGASMCFQKEGVVLVVEIEKNEILAPINALIRATLIGVVVAFILGIIIIVLFMRRPLARINDVVAVAKLATKGDLGAQVEVRTNDELGYLANSFNAMISSVRNAEKELRASKYRVEEEKAKDDALLASLGEGMIAIDNEGRIIVLNKVAEKIVGWSATEAIGKKLVEIIPAIDDAGNVIPPEQRVCLKVATLGASDTQEMTMRFIKKDKGDIPVAVTATPVIINGKNTGAVVIFRDITKEKEIEKTRGDLLSLASHQLRTPLSGTKWLIETLKRGLHGPLTSGQTEYLDEIYKINERMTSLVHDMLGVLRMEGDGATAKKESISTKNLLATVLETLHGTAESKQITIRLLETADYTVDTDALLLGNILESLITNAINYSESGHEVVVNVEQKDSELLFAIKDSGIGIPKDEQQQIFERFYRASNAKTFDTRGSGLGLYIATMLAKKIGAQISFESEVGKGSTFYVHLPQTTARV